MPSKGSIGNECEQGRTAERDPSAPVFSSANKDSKRSQLLGKPNFNFQKRQKELAKKKKTEEKRQRKLEKNADKPAGEPAAGAEDHKADAETNH